MCRVLKTSILDREPIRWTAILSRPVVANNFSSSSCVATSTKDPHPSAEVEIKGSSTRQVLSSLFLCDASLAPNRRHEHGSEREGEREREREPCKSTRPYHGARWGLIPSFGPVSYLFS